jgi:hypothetical protein
LLLLDIGARNADANAVFAPEEELLFHCVDDPHSGNDLHPRRTGEFAMPRTHWITRLWKPLPNRRRDRRAKCFRPFLEALEDRTLLSGQAYVVDVAGDPLNPDGTPVGTGTSGSLRYCVTQADQQANAGSTITFDTAKTGNSIALSHGELVISDSMTITGPGASSLTITANKSSRLFLVSSGGSLTLDNVTLSNGLAQGTSAEAEGGAIYSAGTLALTGVVLKSNTARGTTNSNAYGGGLYVAGGAVTLKSDTLSNNHASGGTGGGGGSASFFHGDHSGGTGGVGSGGGLYVAGGTVTLTNDTLSSNQASGGVGGKGGDGSGFGDGGAGGGGGAGSGGGLLVAAGTVTLTNDTLSSNQASGGSGGVQGNKGPFSGTGSAGNGGTGSGGGVVVEGGAVTLNNATLSNNRAVGGNGGNGPNNGGVSSGYGSGSGGTGFGGGLLVAKGAVTLNNDTLSSNQAVGGTHGAAQFNGGDGSGSGGGIDVASGGDVRPDNTLIAGNLAGGKPSDVVGSLYAASSYNLIGDGSGGLLLVNHNLLGSSASPLNPLLAPLGNYGGTMQTQALLPGSPAIGAGDPSGASGTDQRGVSRNQTAGNDIGAFESQGFTIAVKSGNNQSAAVNTAFAAPLVVAVTAKNTVEPVAGGHVTFTISSSSPPSASFSSDPVTIDGTGMASVAATANATAGTYSVRASASGVAGQAVFSLTNTAAAGQPSLNAAANGPAAAPLTTSAAFPQSVLTPLDEVTPEVSSLQSQGAMSSLEGLFALVFSLAADQAPQSADDLALDEGHLDLDFIMAGENVQALVNNPQALSLADAIAQNPLYNTWAGVLMALAETGLLLGG